MTHAGHFAQIHPSSTKNRNFDLAGGERIGKTRLIEEGLSRLLVSVRGKLSGS